MEATTEELNQIETRAHNLLDLQGVLGVFLLDHNGETFASMLHPGQAPDEGETAGQEVLDYYEENRYHVGVSDLHTHPGRRFHMHFIRGPEGVVCVGATPEANLPAIRILVKQLASRLTPRVMLSLATLVDDGRSPEG